LVRVGDAPCRLPVRFCDLIAGASNGPAIGTLADQACRFTILVYLPGRRHTAETVRDALVAALRPLPAQLRRSLTWDQGKEMALHGQIAGALGMPVFFCGPHSPWQRPTNENTNGLLRQYFPKGTDLRVHAPGQLAAVAAEPGARPRKTLGWDTPAALLAAALVQDGRSPRDAYGRSCTVIRNPDKRKLRLRHLTSRAWNCPEAEYSNVKDRQQLRGTSTAR
jgi:hypothetical protein